MNSERNVYYTRLKLHVQLLIFQANIHNYALTFWPKTNNLANL